ncbi:MAG: hypothetical protein ABSA79_02530 [Candidatus Bathyarchaeia archaeon]|jgi:hypothetical protein
MSCSKIYNASSKFSVAYGTLAEVKASTARFDVTEAFRKAAERGEVA